MAKPSVSPPVRRAMNLLIVKPWQRSGNFAVALILSESVSSSHRRRQRISSSPAINSLLHDVVFVPVVVAIHCAGPLDVRITRQEAVRPRVACDVRQVSTRTATAERTAAASTDPVCRQKLRQLLDKNVLF